MIWLLILQLTVANTNSALVPKAPTPAAPHCTLEDLSALLEQIEPFVDGPKETPLFVNAIYLQPLSEAETLRAQADRVDRRNAARARFDAIRACLKPKE